MAYESKDNGDCDDRVFWFPLTFSLCVIFQETLPEMALTNFSLKEKTNTVGNNEQWKWIVIKATTFEAVNKQGIWMGCKIWLGIFLCKYTTLLLKASDDVKMSEILRWTHSPSICFLSFQHFDVIYSL